MRIRFRIIVLIGPKKRPIYGKYPTQKTLAFTNRQSIQYSFLQVNEAKNDGCISVLGRIGIVRASHLELQSRSLDSYIHAIHSFQVFDIGGIDFNDPVEALHYEHHIGFPFPTHSITNCEACHVEGAYEVPDQSKSLPGALSATDPVEGRNIGDIPLAITGPAARACGGCHRAELIKADNIGQLVALNQHMKREGYLVEGGDDYSATLATVIEQIMAYLK
ncbi:MAG: hypothetical protein KJZ86_01435 [Caldilineaceae bacterium]|nr:hypothetical protein [Caldilineaceae bacterium]HRJ44329.1 hypothetical protein [Caldilineaceae bacterium]